MMSNEVEMRCPLCAEEMDWTDQQLKPCKCGYQVCVWCWHQIMDMAEKDETEGRCPACRSPYDKDKIVGTEAKFERVVANNANQKHKPPKAKAKTNEVRKDLTNIRVMQRRMAYVIGLPLSLADEDLLQRKEFFGQYGKVSKVSLSRTAGGAIQQFVNDTCSVYITFSKEEEAIRCIQSVHGFVLEGRFLRASFGTAKYCHAWLRNMPCNNSACLYLHSIGAEEDSFSKDEVAAVQTRSRVQQIVGATHNLHSCSGNVLPPPIDEHFSYSSALANKPIFKSALKDAAPDTATLNGCSTYLPSPEDKDGGARAPNKMTTFVDVVGRPCCYGPERDGNVAEDRRNLNLSSELSPVGIREDNHLEAAITDVMPCRNFSSSSLLANGLPTYKDFREPFREHSNLWGVGRADVTASDAFMKEKSGLILDSGEQILHGPCSVVKDDFISFDDGRLNDSGSLSQTAPLLPPSHPLKASEDSRNYARQHGETRNLSNYNVGRNCVNNNMDIASVTHASSVNEGYNDKKFQSSAKADRIYRCSNSFSNEEIVEHLRRFDDHDGTKDAQNPALDAVESSIISNIMSLDLDGGDDLSILSPSVTGLFDHTDRRYGSSWNLYNNDQSVFSSTKQQGFDHQLSDLDPFSDFGQDLKKCSAPQDSGENKDRYSCKPQYLVSRAQGLSPTGFSLPSREPTPGFSACERTDQGFNANSGSRMVKTSSFTKKHYRTPSTGNSSNTSDVDIIDPGIMVVGRGKPPNVLTNSCLDTRSIYASQPGTFDDETRLWLLMQQSAPAHQDLKYPQTYMQQVPAARQEPRYSGQIGNGHSSWDDMYGVSSRFAEKVANGNFSNHYQPDLDELQTYNPSYAPSYTPFSQQKVANGNFSNHYQPVLDELQTYNPSYTPFSPQKVANGNFSNRYQPGLDEMQLRNEMGMAELQRNEKLGFNNFYSGYGDYVLQPGSGDLYTRVFGM